MRRIKNILEQHREKGRFKPVIPRYVPNVSVVSPRASSDSADVKLKEDGGLAQNTLLVRKKKPMSTATAENSFQSVKEVIEVGDESSSTEASPNIAKKGGKTVIIKQLDQMKEAKDPKEYGYEGDMAMNQLQTIVRHAEYLMDMLKPDTDLPEWVQSKITLAADYIQTSCDYMTSEMKEEVEQIDEISKGLTHSYFKKAYAQKYKNEPTKPTKLQMRNRNKGMNRAHNRLVNRLELPKGIDPSEGGKYTADSVEISGNVINEGRPSQRHPLEGHEYHKKSDEALIHIAKDAHAAAEAMKSHNTTAENKYRDQANDSATVRHYRKTHGMADWYKKKYGHMKEDTVNESIKKGDYVKDTVHGHVHHVFDVRDNNLIVGRYHGPDSYGGTKNLHVSKAKKVEKPMKESFRPMDEPKYSLSIQARQKKADDSAPFEGPYKKSKGPVVDKSGAKHGPMSIARHLARMAAKKQANVKESTEPLQESRKAEIVREAMKVAKEKKKNNSEDKFIADPELNSKVIKTASQM